MPLVDWVEPGTWQGHGIDSAPVASDPAQPHTGGCVCPCGARGSKGAVVLSGHTDVVPVDGQPWDTDPWSVVETRRPVLRARHVRHERAIDAMAIWAIGGGAIRRRCPTALADGAEL